MPDHDTHTEHDPREPVLSDPDGTEYDDPRDDFSHADGTDPRYDSVQDEADRADGDGHAEGEHAVGHAHVDDDAVADPAAEPVTGTVASEGDANQGGTTYESTSADRANDAGTWNESDTRDAGAWNDGDDRDVAGGPGISAARDDADFRDADDASDGHEASDGHNASDGRDATDLRDDATDLRDVEADGGDRAADEAVAGESGFAGGTAEDEAFRERAAGGAGFGGETVGQTETPYVNNTPLGDEGQSVDAGGVAGVAGDDQDAADRTGFDEPATAVQPDTGTDGEPALMPGAAEEPAIGKLWRGEDADRLRERWRELQLRFIDDPKDVAGAADGLVAEAVDGLTAALRARKDELSGWRSAETGGDDTERLRAAVRRYRDFLDQLLGL